MSSPPSSSSPVLLASFGDWQIYGQSSPRMYTYLHVPTQEVFTKIPIEIKKEVFLFFKNRANHNQMDYSATSKKSLKIQLPDGEIGSVEVGPTESTKALQARMLAIWKNQRYVWVNDSFVLHKRLPNGTTMELKEVNLLSNFGPEDAVGNFYGELQIVLDDHTHEKVHRDLVGQMFKLLNNNLEAKVEKSMVKEWLQFESSFQSPGLRARLVNLHLALDQTPSLLLFTDFSTLFQSWTHSELRLVLASSGSTGELLTFAVQEHKAIGGIVKAVRTWRARTVRLEAHHFVTLRPDGSTSRRFPYLNILSVVLMAENLFVLSFIHDQGEEHTFQSNEASGIVKEIGARVSKAAYFARRTVENGLMFVPSGGQSSQSDLKKVQFHI